MILKITKTHYIILDFNFKEVCKVSKNNSKADLIKQFDIRAYIEEEQKWKN